MKQWSDSILLYLCLFFLINKTMDKQPAAQLVLEEKLTPLDIKYFFFFWTAPEI